MPSSTCFKLLFRNNACSRISSTLSSTLYAHRNNYSSNHRFISTLIVSDPCLIDDGPIIPAATQSSVTAAKELFANHAADNELHLLVVGGSSPPIKIPDGVTKVVHVPFNNTVVPETVANAIVAANSSSYDYILGASTKFGSTIIPRAAACLKPDIASPITDIIEIIDENTFIRPIYAGNALAKVKSKPDVTTKVLTIRPTSFEKSHLVDASSVEVETLNVDEFESSMFVSEAVSGGGAIDRADLGSASVVVSGGRGLKNGENFDMLGKLIDQIAAPGTGAIGASRAAVDAGFVPNDWQVGQTGKVVAPDLYIAVGISGAIQHLSGMKDSKVVVAINKDAEAPIFQVADYGLVADLFTVVPELTEKLSK